MSGEYFPLFVMLVVSVAFAAIGVGVSALIGPRRPTAIKGQTYESGMPSIGTARRRVWVRYYLVAVVFILFDIEIIFFYPWAVVFRQAPLFLLVEMLAFVTILLVGYIYVWRKGGFDWY
ncbi:MAG: NADH-quinone oxidoreductase subunit A 1 [Chloroflexota bacterium]|nr:MAG: NADH-quinone oxidoreductase subunit A 1 [Chloroflexota bacterium]